MANRAHHSRLEKSLTSFRKSFAGSSAFPYPPPASLHRFGIADRSSVAGAQLLKHNGRQYRQHAEKNKRVMDAVNQLRGFELNRFGMKYAVTSNAVATPKLWPGGGPPPPFFCKYSF